MSETTNVTSSLPLPEYFIDRGEPSTQQEDNGQNSPFMAHFATPSGPAAHSSGASRWQINEAKPREQFLKNVTQFSDKNCGENNKLEQFVELSETKTALASDMTVPMASKEQTENQSNPQIEMEQALWQIWQESYEAGKNEIPDLEAAVRYLSQVRERHLTAMARIDARLSNPEMRAQQMRDDLRAIVAASVEARENPAKMIYELAHGFGYGTHNAATRFDHLSEAQRAARTLAASGGREAGHPLSLETLANLGEAEFARWYEDNPHNFRQMFGG